MLIRVNIPGGGYSVCVGKGVETAGARIRELSESLNAYIISDSNVWNMYGERLSDSLRGSGFCFDLFVIDPGESSKSLETAADIYSEMSRIRLERFTPVIGFGGGVAGDLAGFVASTYLRGLPFFNIPTTLLAQVDSSVGGKTGVNLPSGKNLVGTFYQPRYVHADVEVLSTLPPREYAGGLAEVVKHAVIEGEGFLEILEKSGEPVMRRDPSVLEKIVSDCVKIKARVVEKDEKEKGLRRVLNLGHTLAHALEAASSYGTYTHGEAVSIGLVAAALISERTGGEKTARRLKSILGAFELPVRISPALEPEKLIEIMKLDKKVRSGRIEFVLPLKPGDVRPGVAVDEKVIKETIEELIC